MSGRRRAKVAIDVAMAAVLAAVMATALVQEVPHERLGVALFVLMVAHAILNRRWLASVFRGRYGVVRVLQVVVLVGLSACVLGQVASSLVLSKHAFGWLPSLPGASWARRMHMLCSYWSFVLAFAHAGLHVRMPRHLSAGRLWAIRAVLFAIACYGAYSFVRLGMLPYLAGQMLFAAADFGAPMALALARYASVGVLVACLAHCVRMASEATARRGRQP
ncbi:MAG: DUF4405 domain-containing protein [Olsenella sp.]|nr:DUF4405 domain-containing protein [Olsenella sp.]